MDLTITQTRTPSTEEWNSIWLKSNNSTFYHSSDWHSVWSKYTNNAMTTQPVLFEFSDSTVAIAPISLHKALKGIIKRYVSSPATTYGGWFSSNELTETHNRLIFKYLTDSYPTLIFRTNPLITFKPDGFAPYLSEDFTQTISLDTDFETQYKTWTKGHRSAVTKARKLGVTARVGTTSADWDAFYEIYLDSISRWGSAATSKYKPEFFNNIYNLKSKYVKLWLADYQGKPITGCIILYSEQHAMYAFSAALGEFFKLRAVNLLLHDVIKQACEQKYQYFDFNPSGGHKGVVGFKKSFGSSPVPSYVFKRQAGWINVMEKAYKTWLLKTS